MSGRSDGTIEQSGDIFVFRYERHLRHQPERVWSALVHPAEVEAWFGVRVELDPRVGGEYVTYHRGGQRVVDRVVVFDPPSVFEHTFWVEVNPSALVRWEIQRDDDGSVLTLTHTMSVDDLRRAAEGPAVGDSFATILSRNGAGWHHILDRLAATLDGKDLERSAVEMQALQQQYAALLP
jgi:uncharacterized protein YndB with AHSA1/START domain